MNSASSDPEGERRLREAIYGKPDRARGCCVYDAECINPAYCNEHDACCAGDPDCKPAPSRGER